MCPYALGNIVYCNTIIKIIPFASKMPITRSIISSRGGDANAVQEQHLRSVLAPVDGGDIGVAVRVDGKLVARVGSSRELLEGSALGNQADRSTAGGDVLLDLAGRADGGGSLLDDVELGALVVGKGLVADDKGLRSEVAEALGELGDLNGLGAEAAVDVDGGDSLGAGIQSQRDAVRREGSALVGDGGGAVEADVGGSAVLVEDARVVALGANASLVESSTDVDAVDVEALDRGREVKSLVGDVDVEAEASGLLDGRVVGDDVEGRGSSGADKANESSSRDKHLEGCCCCFVGWLVFVLCWRLETWLCGVSCQACWMKRRFQTPTAEAARLYSRLRVPTIVRCHQPETGSSLSLSLSLLCFCWHCHLEPREQLPLAIPITPHNCPKAQRHRA